MQQRPEIHPHTVSHRRRCRSIVGVVDIDSPVAPDLAPVVRFMAGLELSVATAVGPRVLGIRPSGGDELFASLPGLRIDDAGVPPFSFRGGHRLWVAPEEPAVTYAADDRPVTVDDSGDGIVVTGPVDTAGWQKTVTLEPAGAGRLDVGHRLVNHGLPRHAAAWAITQLRPGGRALLPLGTARPDAYQADRSIVLWPYTRWDDPGITIGEHLIEIDGTRRDPAKIGTALGRSWMAYRLGSELFVKRPIPGVGVAYADLGATAQVFVNRHFVELETLGPLTRVGEGEAIEHREEWEVRDVDPAAPVETLVGLLEDSALPVASGP
jgi:hypothetical protein